MVRKGLREEAFEDLENRPGVNEQRQLVMGAFPEQCGCCVKYSRE